MKSIIALIIMLVMSSVALAAQGPTDRVKLGVSDIISIASDSALSVEQKKQSLSDVIEKHVDIQASAQRVLGKYWREASDSEKRQFMVLLKGVLVDTYIVLLEKYDNETVAYTGETIKKKVYATVDTDIHTKDNIIPVSYQLYQRNDEWKIYDFVAEGLSMIRTFSKDYQSTLKKSGVSGLNEALAAKLAQK
ncbi:MULTISPECIES: ABC transporter substrate-binding protein [Shewanella]|jgi:phospholipid transport system substrate-binding protein|uniref:MlaC/ttg2D family ABC transporter substrate-binding protein n=1 Tax=Shewanella TaxID=22 RepID=UPI000C3C3A19|nr:MULTISPECIES: ABC transporter substrate-binding protein [Shewanella]NCQ45117.1 ABC transporter substrate-binding protein [Shewanella frigidimarina]MBB1323190.1 ABC transporter substrate-binding protein [Shewanella sp. SR43-8]MBB1388159.1 ABC transporter substrate-binding protein [Shewanella sp. SG44-6]NCO70895.1 ABC transporter substrate-binding protein [Shewanella vesiculosa]NCP37012.1 ABC transporter substrate-binding protein [Shewanella vesiculosa]|tara:strand:- start:47 stop:622 length:576 start_codon:yes stop_codon:yes gene_type:complete